MNAALPKEAVAVALLPITKIAESPSNPRKRFDDAYIDELSKSIKEHGLIQPVTVRPHPVPGSPWPYELVIGACRLRAAERAGLAEIPGFWRELTDKQVLEIQIIENLQRQDVHPIEEAEGYEQLIKLHNYRAEEIAEKIGKSRGYVYARLKLTALCHAAREEFYADRLDASTALLIARIPGEALQKKAAKSITTGGFSGEPMSYRNAKYHIQNNFTISLKQATFSLDDAKLLPAAGSCADCPKRSGNAPDICTDLADVDVCTDTRCFDNKRIARHDQLIANAEKRKIQVLTGEAAREVAPNGLWSLDEDRYVALDEPVDDDAEHRTLRQILGDKTPVAAVLELGNNERDKRLVELGDPSSIEKALKKAGWKPSEEQPKSVSGESAEARARREAQATEHKAKQEAEKLEGEYRKTLAAHVLAQVRSLLNAGDGKINTDKLISLMAVAWLRFDFSFNEEVDFARLEPYGIAAPEDDEYDDYVALADTAAVMQQWPVGTAAAFLLDGLTSEETNTNIFNFDAAKDRPHTLLALAEMIGLDTESLRKPASTPTEAAQAHGKDATPAAPAKPKASAKKPAAKKPEAKANPAPASPANEPATPVKTAQPSLASQAWPFPTGNRP